MTPRNWRGAGWRALSLGAGLALAAGLAVLAQPSNQTTGSGAGSGSESGPPASETPPGVPVIQAPPETESPSANVVTSAPIANPKREEAATNAAAKEAEAKPPPAPPPPPKPVRSPAAIVQALDKVTAETMRFAVPVGKPIRYKNLVFVVKACESTGLGGPSPNASAYMVVDNAPLPTEGVSPAPKQVFKGWMFANSPGLNPLQSPTYDAWLIACMAAPPPT
ncbi:MAG TPA: DUF2155 domain-containing protein [Caulobacteraceae bacterium]|nr:DUF2155 domain-containing protein [Caulobacteraceae bacterium]